MDRSETVPYADFYDALDPEYELSEKAEKELKCLLCGDWDSDSVIQNCSNEVSIQSLIDFNEKFFPSFWTSHPLMQEVLNTSLKPFSLFFVKSLESGMKKSGSLVVYREQNQMPGKKRDLN